VNVAHVRNIPAGEAYEPLPGEQLLQLTAAEAQLYVGIRKGEYMLAQPEPAVTYVLTQEQSVRLRQQLKLQPTYQSWVKTGLLTITDVTVPPEPPPVEPPPE
jgi:hypothetical protein